MQAIVNIMNHHINEVECKTFTMSSYRSCVSVLVVRKNDPKRRILILHKPRKRDAWQLPQGGVEKGESYEEALVREIKEEAGVYVQILDKSKVVYQYDYPASYKRFRGDGLSGQRIEFFFALADADARIEVDRKEIDAYAWVGVLELGKYVKRRRYLEVIRRMYAEINT